MSRIVIVFPLVLWSSCQADIAWDSAWLECPTTSANGQPLDTEAVVRAAALAVEATTGSDDYFASEAVWLDHTFVANGPAELVDFGLSGEACSSRGCWTCPVGLATRVEVSHAVTGTIAGHGVSADAGERVLYAASADPADITILRRDWSAEVGTAIAAGLATDIAADPELGPCVGLAFTLSTGQPLAPEEGWEVWSDAAGHGSLAMSCPEVSSDSIIAGW